MDKAALKAGESASPAKGDLGKGGPATQEAPLSLREAVARVWKLRPFYTHHLLPAAGLLLFALVQTDLALVGTVLSQRMLDGVMGADAEAAASSAGGVTLFVGRLVPDAWLHAAPLPTALLLVAVLVLVQAMGIAAEWGRTRLNHSFRSGLQRALTRSFIQSGVPDNHAKAMVTFTQDAGSLSALLIFGLLSMAEQGIKLVGYCVAAVRIGGAGWLLALVAPPLGLLVPLGIWRLFARWENSLTGRSESTMVVSRTLALNWFRHLRNLLFVHGDRSSTERLLHASDEAARLNLSMNLVSSLRGSLAAILTTFSLPAVVLVLTSKEPVSPGVIIQAQTLCVLIWASTGALAAFPSMLQRYLPSLRRVSSVLEQPEPGPQPEELERLLLNASPPALKLEKLTFTLASGRTMLNQLSLEVPAGACVGIVGAPGCGKSTAARVIVGECRPTSGAIFVGGVEVTHLPGYWRRDLIGYLPDKVLLLRGTLNDNLLYGRSVDDVKAVLDFAIEHSLLQTVADEQPEGWERRITKDGDEELSGGEKRLMGIARLLCDRQPVLILDEPGAQLSPQKMALLAAKLRVALKARTSLLITHDPDIFLTDFNVFLKDGAVAATGTHAELMSTCPDYRDLVERKAAVTMD